MKNSRILNFVIISFLSILFISVNDSYSRQNEMRSSSTTGDDIISRYEIYISPHGKDSWSGRFPDPTKNGMDGPLKTIHRALEIIHFLRGETFQERTFRKGECPSFLVPPGSEAYGGLPGNIVVWLREGEYFIDKTISITPSHSYPIIFAAYNGEKPVLTGGVKIKNWEITKVNGITAWVASIPDAIDKSRGFAQLFVNGRRAQRVRYPKTGFFIVEDPLLPNNVSIGFGHKQDQFISAPGDLKPWKGIRDAEIVTLHYWIEQRLPVASFDPKTRLVTLARMTRSPLLSASPAHSGGNARYYIENVFETLSDPGEWYLDKLTGKLYYIPLEGEKPEESEVIVPITNQLITIQGNPKQGQFVENIQFKGITFKYNSLVNKDGDYGSITSAFYQDFPVILMEGARNIAVEDCEFLHIGGYGISLRNGCQGIRIIGNQFKDMAAGAINATGARWTDNPAERTMLNRITDNTIESGGRFFTDARAINLTHVHRTIIAHNLIHDFYYTGISVQSWDPSYNLIENNHIYNIGQGMLNDMGGIYVPGPQLVEIRGNKIHDIKSAVYGANCIYADDNARQAIIENNLCYNTNYVLITVKGSENIIRNNILAFGSDGCIKRAGPTPTEGGRYVATVEKNILVSRNASIFQTGYYIDIFSPVWNSDFNLICDYSGNDITCEQSISGAPNLKVKFNEWITSTGNDRNTIIADPLFEDIHSYDFRLKESSPAYKLGFKPVEFLKVGPRPKEERAVFEKVNILKQKELKLAD